MTELEIRFKLLCKGARLPSRAHEDDAGLDLYCVWPVQLGPGEIWRVSLGLASELPPGHVALIQDRSSLASEGIHVLGGVMDSGYRGEWQVLLVNLGRALVSLPAGSRVAQAVILPLPRLVITEVSELASSARASAGFGSTGQ